MRSNPPLHAITHRAEWILWFMVAFLLTLPLLFWFLPGVAERTILERLAPKYGVATSLSGPERLLGCAGSMLPTLALGAALGAIARLFRLVRNGAGLTRRAVAMVRLVGTALFSLGALLPVSRLIILYALHVESPWTQLVGVFTPGLGVVTYLALGAAIRVLAVVLEEAVRLAEENASFV